MSSGQLIVELDQNGSAATYNGIGSNQIVNDGKFHYISVVRSGTGVSLYIDGALDSSNSTTGVTDLSASPPADFMLGAEPSGTTFPPLTGALDDVQIYNGTALSTGQVQSIYSAGASSFTQSGGTTTVAGSLAADPATIQGGVLTGTGTVFGSVVNSGIVFPGSGAGTGILSIDGNYAQTSAGFLQIELGGTTAGTEYNQLLSPSPAAPPSPARSTCCFSTVFLRTSPTPTCSRPSRPHRSPALSAPTDCRRLRTTRRYSRATSRRA